MKGPRTDHGHKLVYLYGNSANLEKSKTGKKKDEMSVVTVDFAPLRTTQFSCFVNFIVPEIRARNALKFYFLHKM